MDKKYLINVLLYVLLGVVGVSLIAFVLFHLLDAGKTTVFTRPAVRISAEDTIEAYAYLFKDETVLYANEDGKLYADGTDGENLRKGNRAAALYRCDEETLLALQECDRLLALLKSAQQKEGVATIDGQLKSSGAALRKNSESGDLYALSLLLDDLSARLARRRVAVGVDDGYASEIAQLQQQRTALLSKLGAPAERILAPFAGNYSASCDGYETVFSSDKLEEITPEAFDLLVRSRAQTPPQGKQFAGKMSENSLWRLAMTVSAEEALPLVSGRSYTLVLEDSNQRLSMTLSRIAADPAGDRTLLVFSSRDVPAVAPARCERVQVVSASYTGLMVPNAAVRCIVDETTGARTVGVYVKEGNRYRFKKVDILCQKDGYFVAKEMTPDLEGYKEYLSINDVVVTAGKDLAEGYRE